MATSETPIKLESRVAILEEKVTQLQRTLEAVAPEAKPWWKDASSYLRPANFAVGCFL